MERESWFSVRCVFEIQSGCFEERITVWRARTFDDAFEMAEAEANQYAGDLPAEYLGLAQAYQLATTKLGPGAEVFSLMRESTLSSEDYLDTYFDSGTERQQTRP